MIWPRVCISKSHFLPNFGHSYLTSLSCSLHRNPNLFIIFRQLWTFWLTHHHRCIFIGLLWEFHHHRLDIYGHLRVFNTIDLLSMGIWFRLSPLQIWHLWADSYYHHHRFDIYEHLIEIFTTIDLLSMGIWFRLSPLQIWHLWADSYYHQYHRFDIYEHLIEIFTTIDLLSMGIRFIIITIDFLFMGIWLRLSPP